MANKRKPRSGNPPKPKPKQVTTGLAPLLNKPAVLEPKPRRSLLRWWPLAVLGLVIVVVGAGSWWFFLRPNPDKTANQGGQMQASGDVSCVEQPKFVQNLHITTSPSFSTSERNVKGLALLIPTTNGQYTTYQHPSWSSAGSLASLEFGKSGELFVVPAPSINVLYNPPDEQNQVYRIDGDTSVMSRLVSLPRAGPPNPENPFGALGLGFDCQTNHLYVSSVAGSDRDHEIGRIYAVDVAKAAVQTELDNVDPLGLAVFNGAKGKRLYYGLARFPEVWSVGLDAQGNFVGQPRLEFSLANLGIRGSDKARKIEFVQGTQMVVHGIEFSFNLIAPTEKQETIYRFNYDAAKDSWSQVKDAS